MAQMCLACVLRRVHLFTSETAVCTSTSSAKEASLYLPQWVAAVGRVCRLLGGSRPNIYINPTHIHLMMKNLVFNQERELHQWSERKLIWQPPPIWLRKCERKPTGLLLCTAAPLIMWVVSLNFNCRGLLAQNLFNFASTPSVHTTSSATHTHSLWWILFKAGQVIHSP